MKCPNCSSENTLTCELAYEQGKSTSSGTAAGEKITVNSITAFAQRAAPPTNSFGFFVFMLVITGIITFLALANDSSQWAKFGVSSFLLVTPFAAWQYIKLPSFRRRHAEWTREWICRSCGNKFIPS